MSWVFFAIGSAFFAGLTAILGKLGVEGMNSNLATFIRTLVILGEPLSLKLIIGSILILSGVLVLAL